MRCVYLIKFPAIPLPKRTLAECDARWIPGTRSNNAEEHANTVIQRDIRAL